MRANNTIGIISMLVFRAVGNRNFSSVFGGPELKMADGKSQ